VTPFLYLDRIGFAPDEANKIISAAAPSVENLQKILTAHLLAVPFENMDQHEHPACSSSSGSSNNNAPLVPRKQPADLPSLNDIEKTLTKIIHKRRGGFCFELNFAFGWLLRNLGYSVRFALADVSCQQIIPAHVVILVDGLLLLPTDASPTTVLVDVGFGTPGVCEVVLPLEYDQPRTNPFGDVFRFDALRDHARFDTTLYRTRIYTKPDEEEPMYRFQSNDDMPMESNEFEKGLHHVLNNSPTFNGKRLCVLSTEKGHLTLGKDYIKWVDQGGSKVTRKELSTETLWRNALEDHFGVILQNDE